MQISIPLALLCPKHYPLVDYGHHLAIQPNYALVTEYVRKFGEHDLLVYLFEIVADIAL